MSAGSGSTAEAVPMIEDLSTNGTFINSKPLGKGNRIMLEHGDEIGISRRKGVFEHHFIFQTRTRADPDTSVDEDSPFHRDYNLRHELGRGNFSIVKLAIHKRTGDQYAVKIIDRRRFAMNSKITLALDREVEILKSITHPNVVRFHDVFGDNDRTFLVMELVSGGDFMEYITTRGLLGEAECQWFFRQMIMVVKYLHGRGITHRDLKPENFLVTEGRQLKLADFGLARAVGAEVLSTVCGTPIYLAPEVITSTQVAAYGLKVDLYSLGVILYFMVSGRPPFDDTEQQLVYEKIRRGDVLWDEDVWRGKSAEVIDLIRRLMERDPVRRIEVEGVEEHVWMRKSFGDEPSVPLQHSSQSDRSMSGPPETPLDPGDFSDAVTVATMMDDQPWGVLVAQDGENANIVLSKASVKLGRRPDMDVVLSDPRISGFHCVFALETDGGTMLEDNSANGMRVNTVKIGKGNSHKIHFGDVITLVPENQKQARIDYVFEQKFARNMKRSLTDTSDGTVVGPGLKR
ncbi:Checkpoint kinase 2, partial [Rhizophlyctis rosea]